MADNEAGSRSDDPTHAAPSARVGGMLGSSLLQPTELEPQKKRGVGRFSTADVTLDHHALFDATPTPLLVVAPPDWTIVAANKARVEITGIKREDIVGQKLFEAFPDDPDDPEATGVRNLSASLQRVLATGKADTMPLQLYPLRNAAGEFVDRWWSPVNTPVLGRNGEVTLVIHRVEEVTDLVRMREEAAARDKYALEQQALIDQQRRNETALRASEARFRAAVEATNGVLWTNDAAGRMNGEQHGWGALTGQSQAEYQGYGWASAVHPDDAQPTIEAWNAAVSNRRQFLFEHRVKRRDGVWRRFAIRAAPVLDDAGQIREWVGIHTDITDANRAQTRFRQLAETIDDVFYVFEIEEGCMSYVSPAYETIWRQASDELHADPLAYMRRVHPDDRHRTDRALALQRAGKDSVVRYRLVFDDGQVRHIHDRAYVTADPDTGARRVVGIAEDVTEQMLAHELQREGEERFRVFAQFMPIHVWSSRPDGYLDWFNGQVYAYCGGELGTLDGARWTAAVHPEDLQVASKAWTEALATGKRYEAEFRVRRADGVYRHFLVRADPVTTADGRIKLWVGTNTDIEDQKLQTAALAHLNATLEDKVAERTRDLTATETALRQAQKMEAMGQLTGGVAHDFNNLLTPIIGSLDMLLRRGVGTDRERRLIDGALQSADRAKTLVQRLLAFARRQPLQPVAVDLTALMSGMADLVASTVGPNIHVRLDLADGLPPANADPNQLEMALLNLCVNARDAMPDGGTLTIGASRDSVRVADAAGLRLGHYVRLWVADTGTGMDAETLARAVEPFFSTKGVGKGTGLGLSMVHGLAAQLGGGLTVDSKVGRGTMIELWLPLSLGAPEVRNGVGSSPSTATSRGRVLLVDDEDLVRMSTSDMLTDMGFEVIEVSSAEQALTLLDADGVDLVITDHLMPGMSGAELAREVRERSLDLPVLIVSGYAEIEGIAPHFPRLTKPFRQSELAEIISGLQRTSE